MCNESCTFVGHGDRTCVLLKLLQRKHWRMEAPLDVYGSPLAFQQPPFIQVCSLAPRVASRAFCIFADYFHICWLKRFVWQCLRYWSCFVVGSGRSGIHPSSAYWAKYSSVKICGRLWQIASSLQCMWLLKVIKLVLSCRHVDCPVVSSKPSGPPTAKARRPNVLRRNRGTVLVLCI